MKKDLANALFGGLIGLIFAALLLAGCAPVEPPDRGFCPYSHYCAVGR